MQEIFGKYIRCRRVVRIIQNAGDLPHIAGDIETLSLFILILINYDIHNLSKYQDILKSAEVKVKIQNCLRKIGTVGTNVKPNNYQNANTFTLDTRV